MRPYGQRPPHSSLHGSDCGVCSPADVEPARARRSAADEIAEGLAEWADLDGPPCCPIVGGVRVCDCAQEPDYADEPDPLALLEAEVRAYERGLDALRLGRL